MRTFPSGAMRGSSMDKIDPEGALSPLVLEAYCEFIRKHRPDGGNMRTDDNWQLGIPNDSYMKSLLRHVIAAWKAHRGWKTKESLKDSLCATMFNTQGMLHEILKIELEVEGYQPQQPWTNPPYNVPYVNEQGDNCTMINAATPTSTMKGRSLETEKEWLEFQRNMTASSLPSEDDWNDRVRAAPGGLTGPQYD